MKISIKLNKKALLKAAAVCMAIPVLFFGIVKTLPYVSDGLSLLTAFSVATDYPGSGVSLKDYGKSASSKDYESVGKDVVMANTEPSATDSTDTASEEIKQVTAGTKPAAAGSILRKTYTAGTTGAYISLGNGYIKNCTSLTSGQILAEVNKKPDMKIAADGSPEVLIMHTHTTECYQDTLSQWFDLTAPTRTRDTNKNVVRVGDEIAKELKAAGIGVLHDKTEHDYPSYVGAYDRSAVTVKSYLKKYPSIKIVLDVHRDAIVPDKTQIISPVTTINGKDCAQLMMIVCADDGSKRNPKYMENLKFSVAIQRQLASDYKNLDRPILFDYKRYYNQELTTGSILLEVGGHANTLDEAIYCGELTGKSIAKTLLNMK